MPLCARRTAGSTWTCAGCSPGNPSAPSSPPSGSRCSPRVEARHSPAPARGGVRVPRLRQRDRSRGRRRRRTGPRRGRVRADERLPRVREHRRRARVHDLGLCRRRQPARRPATSVTSTITPPTEARPYARGFTRILPAARRSASGAGRLRPAPRVEFANRRDGCDIASGEQLEGGRDVGVADVGRPS